jgi:Flp pilus assembly protein TadD
MFDALQNGDTLAAFQKAYGKPIEDVEQDLRAYARGDAFNTAVFDLRLPDVAGAPRVETNAALPARLALAELLSNDYRTLPQAAAAYKALAREYENRWEIEDGWGEFCAREREDAEAVRHFARAAGLGSDNARMYLQYGRVLHRKRRYADAIDVLEMGLRLDSTLGDLHFELAVTLVHAGRDRDAVAEFHRIQKLDREYAYRYFYNLAVAHARLGDTGQARRLIDKARPETRNSDETAALDQLLQSLAAPR